MATLTRICPICNIALQRATRQEVEIDYCPQCRGIWLDRGELEKIIERSTPMTYKDETDERGGYYREDRRSGHHDRRNEGGHDGGYDVEQNRRRERRGGFLGDLFDF